MSNIINGVLANNGRYNVAPVNSVIAGTRYSVLTCPADIPTKMGSTTNNSYVVNYGNTGLNAATTITGGWLGATVVAQNGTPFRRAVAAFNKTSGVPLSAITDGTSNTAGFSEVIMGIGDYRGFIWWGDQAGYAGGLLPPNTSLPDMTSTGGGCANLPLQDLPCTPNVNPPNPGAALAARSRHDGGVNVCLCDGSVRFVTNNVTAATWLELHSIQGRASVGDF